jgi:hypothetical protein
MRYFVFTVTTQDGEHYRIVTDDPEPIHAGLQYLDDCLHHAAANGSLSAWWALEGRYRFGARR